MTKRLSILGEPELEFRHGQRVADPHAGLSLFGPFDADAASRPGRVVAGVIGPADGVSLLHKFADRIAYPVISQRYGDPDADEDRKSQLLWPPFPGFEAAFSTEWPGGGMWAHRFDREKLLNAARHNDPYRRAYDVAQFYLTGARIARERDEGFKVLLCVVPDEVWINCRPKSRVVNGIGIRVSKADRKSRRQGADLFGAYEPEEYELSVDFRRQLKARAMEYGVPLQLVRESTLLLRESEPQDSRGLTCFSDRAWNLSTALYYKAGGKPWRLATAREGVCYVGLAFRQSELDDDDRTACCAAQMFLDSGDGVVFRGQFGPWYSETDDAYHLNATEAEHMLRGVLHAYREQDGRPLQEVFLHSRSTMSAAEFAGYQQACPAGVKLVGVRVRRDRDGLRLFRPGQWPVLRGTAWVISDRTAYLWATGFKPSVLTYDGWEVPVPLRIDIEHGHADVEQVTKDILGLTKLNYNACKLGAGQPVTVGFSATVGEILVGNPKIRVRHPSFKHYI